ncbi:MAG: acyltransferase [Chitinophagaceae bacterium]|nr:acyltransferase [Chitinophagaceae bacterium]
MYTGNHFNTAARIKGEYHILYLTVGKYAFYSGIISPLIFHFWSLGVEEQFYLFWPWVMKRIGNPFKWISWFILIMLFLKLMGYVIYKKTGSYLLYDIVHVTRFHCMAFGALGAILWQRQVKWLRGLCFSNWVVSICWIILLLAGFNKFHFASVIDNELISIITVLLILNLSFGPKPLINLESWFLNFLGKISFGVYVYHPLLIFLLSYFLGSWIRSLEFNSRVIFVYFISVTATILLAAISYELLERPFLSMKDRFSKVLSAPNEKLNESTS